MKYRNITKNYLYVTASPGSDLFESIKDAIQAAIESEVVVRLTHNGKTYEVDVKNYIYRIIDQCGMEEKYEIPNGRTSIY